MYRVSCLILHLSCGMSTVNMIPIDHFKLNLRESCCFWALRMAYPGDSWLFFMKNNDYSRGFSFFFSLLLNNFSHAWSRICWIHDTLSFISPSNNQIMLQEYAICLPCWKFVLDKITTFLSGDRDHTEETLLSSLVDTRCWEHVHEQMYSILTKDAFLKVASWFQILWPYFCWTALCIT